jgi:hypothetical protein
MCKISCMCEEERRVVKIKRKNNLNVKKQKSDLMLNLSSGASAKTNE